MPPVTELEGSWLGLAHPGGEAGWEKERERLSGRFCGGKGVIGGGLGLSVSLVEGLPLRGGFWLESYKQSKFHCPEENLSLEVPRS